MNLHEMMDFVTVEKGNAMAEYFEREAAIADMHGAKAVSLHDIYRVIAGHSYYHGDRILAALTCIAEGKEVNPVRPADVAPVRHGRWGSNGIPDSMLSACSVCGFGCGAYSFQYCPKCGARMNGECDA